MDEESLKSLIAQGEGYRLEFKESYSDKIGKEICAFANSKGGKILLGVTDNGTIKGIEISNSLKSKIYDLTTNFDPPLKISIEIVEPVLIITVDEGINKPYSVAKKYYMRYGANSQPLKRDELRDFFRAERLVDFDDGINEAFSLERDFNEELFRQFLERAKISPVIERNRILENQGLLKNNHILNAGVLLFCKEITQFFLNATINCCLYMGTTKSRILDKKELNRDILTNYNQAIQYLMSHLNTEYIIKSGPREERLELPEAALREAVLNAIAHRDYFSTENIQVNIYKDRVDITNPGGLMGGLSIAEIYTRSIPRNPLLFNSMMRMELVEKAGSGLVRIENEMKDYGLEKPIFHADTGFFKVTFRRPAMQEKREPDSRDPVGFFDLFLTYQAVVLLFQESRWTAEIKNRLLDQANTRFGKDNVLHLVPPFNSLVDLKEYFVVLGKQCGFKRETTSPASLIAAFEERLSHGTPLFIMVSGFEGSFPEGRPELAGVLRSLNERFTNFYFLICGGEQLADLAYSGTLSYLTNARIKEWPEMTVNDVYRMVKTSHPHLYINDKTIEKMLILSGGHPGLLELCFDLYAREPGFSDDTFIDGLVQLPLTWNLFAPFKEDPQLRPQICEYLGKDDVGPYNHLYHDPLVKRLYWKNLLKRSSSNFRLCWRCDALRRAGKKLLACE